MQGKTQFLKGFGMLSRILAVAFSSFVTILSTSIPLILFYPEVSNTNVLILIGILLLGSFLTHGLLTHIVNDLADFKSGTDEYSPGVLSGGSRVIQTKVFTYAQLKLFGVVLTAVMALAAVLFFIFGYTVLGILTILGMWGAISYSMRPFIFAYKPLAGEWLSLFPSMLALGLAAPWIMLDSIPVWAWFNAAINAIWCMAWVMVHHIPDMDADQRAKPVKNTSVLYAANRWGRRAAHLPAVLYLAIIGVLAVIMTFTRPLAGIITLILIIITILMLFDTDKRDVEAVTATEKKMLIMAALTALMLGFII
ncbi:prenyltransferase [Salinicoccus halitifaciens]|uniref:1,4-dihydroxy-2-naphthoate octaprenyltransferase n=1 Tax=Salinicoccus halitifaciens TaxID=1073415 RepID=A0ABV2ED58_9STAP|nr:prenyltransferase [Salinicoccus halitifaciens]MCD2137365.1 prenyltransferase [Salinicoccus halitifaciens]